jgi:outer membrane receptor protein involved in Fe transport
MWLKLIKMKLLNTLVLALCLLSFTNHAQTVEIKGKVIDNLTKEPLPFVGVTINDINGKFIIGKNTDLEGQFVLKLELKESLIINYRFVGYTTKIDTVYIVKNKKELNLGEILLSTASNLLEGAKVQGEKADMIMEADRKVFNVENTTLAQGGTTLDILRQIPTVDIDVDGNVVLRGSSDVQIYINGRQSGMSGSNKQAIFEQIPASNVERIEIITNPSSKFDSEGTAGIINIILKSNKKKGWNSTLVAGVGTNNKYNGSASYSYVKNKFAFSSTYGYRYNQNWRSVQSDRKNFFEDTSFYVNQIGRGMNYSNNHTWNGNIDYEINKKNTLSINWIGGMEDRSAPENVNYEFLDESSNLGSTYYRNRREYRDAKNGDVGFNWISKFDTKGHQLSFLGNYSYSDKKELANFIQDLEGNFRQNQNTNIYTINKLPILQLDYTKPLKNESKFESGAKFTLRDIDNNFLVDTLDFSNSNIIPNLNLSNRMLYKEYVNAIYANFNTKYKKTKIQGGLRVENTNIDGLQVVNNVNLDNSYTNLFPSVYLTQEIKKGHEIQTSYSRRINRPSLEMLNPFAEQTDPFNLRTGNPKLNPELIDAVEASYFANKNGDFLSGTVYYRQVNGSFQRIRSVDNEGVATMTFINLDVSRNVGLEGVVRKKIKNVNTTLNLNLFRNQATGSFQNNTVQAVNYSWFGKLLVNYKLLQTIDIQASYNYRGKITYVQGTIEPMHNLDIGIKKDFWNKKGNLALSITDVFNTRQFVIENGGENFAGNAVRRWETRIATLNFTYKIGNSTPEMNKKPNKPMRGEGSGDMEF